VSGLDVYFLLQERSKMTQEKRQRKAGAPKRSAKNSAEKPALETSPLQAASVDSPTVKTPTKVPTKAVKTRAKAKAKSLQVSLEEIIRLRAYEIYLQRGATPGNPHEDWDVAEREVRAHFGQADAQ
jgi:hypothetical protein